MGNAFVFEGGEEPPGPGEEVAFFNTIRIKWLDSFISKVKDVKRSEFSIHKGDEMIRWLDYFRIFTEVKDAMASDLASKRRVTFHVACSGYAMTSVVWMEESDPDESQIVTELLEDQPEDAYTDDDASEIEEIDEEDNRSETNDPSTQQLNSPDNGDRSKVSNRSLIEGSDRLEPSAGANFIGGINNEDTSDVGDQPLITRDSGIDHENEVGETEGGQLNSDIELPCAVEKETTKQTDKMEGRSGIYPTSKSISAIESKKYASGWNPHLINPIFFGKSRQKAKEADKEEYEAKAAIAARETRAILKAKSSRGMVIDAMEKTMKNQERIRLEKMDQLSNRYTTAKNKREQEYERNQRELLDVAFRIYERQYFAESDAADYAFETEMSELKLVHAEKTAENEAYLAEKRADMEAFKDAEKQEVPAAERLENFARVEVSRSIDELEELSIEMEKMRREYREMKVDFDAAVANLEQEVANGSTAASLKGKQRKVSDLKSIVSVAETRMREAQRRVQEGLEGLGDAEILLDRAVRIRSQQEELLPLFALIANNRVMPSECRLNALVISLILLMDGTFEQKYNYLFRLFDAECSGSARLPFIVALLSNVQEAMYLLRMISVKANEEELINMVTRGFISNMLHPANDFVTEFELKHIILHLVSRSNLLVSALGISMLTRIESASITFEGTNSSQMGQYQRSRMSPLALLSRGMINLSMCKLRLHNEAVRFRAALSPSRMQTMHDRSMLMGQDDPLKADYSKFLKKQAKSEKYRVDPLDNGHLLNLRYFDDRTKTEAAIKLQSIARSMHDRKVAELAARRLAFFEAKEAAMKEMKAKVVREFKKRESGKGMGKMKWDAQVRMKQAKLRTSGQSVGRSDTVMIMMEEAISAAKEDIEERFKELEQKEEFYGMSFERDRTENNPSRGNFDITQLFGILVRPSIADKSIILDEKDHVENPVRRTPAATVAQSSQPSSASAGDDGGGEECLSSTGALVTAIASDDDQLVTSASAVHEHDAAGMHQMFVMNQKRVKMYIQGKHTTPLLHHHVAATAVSAVESVASDPASTSFSTLMQIKGEHEMEWELRRMLAAPEVDLPLHFFNRLRAMNIACTQFKTNELLAELPSKRLLLKYCAAHSDEEIANDLTQHFKFKGHQHQIVKLFRNLLRSDLETGTINWYLFKLQMHSESGILNLFEDQMAAFTNNLNSMIELRLQTNEKLKEHDAIEDELRRVGVGVQKYKSLCVDALTAIDVTASKFKKLLLSYQELDKKRRCIQQMKLSLSGKYDQTQKDVPTELRYNWILRISAANQMRENSAVDTRKKYSEIRNVCREFIDTATSDAAIIINEIYLPKYLKTIPVSGEFAVDGRPADCGRGIEDGKWYDYEAHNIHFKVSLDYDGVFNGSDECAMKAGGKDRLGAQEYFKLQIPRLHCPLVVTVDYFGFRVVAVSKLPTQNVYFNEDGDVRKVAVDLVHGVQSHGENFVNRSKIAQNLLKVAANKLNLAEHSCRGSKDISSSATFGSSELKIFKGQKDDFYVQDFWRAFPPESPTAAPHLYAAARGQSVFWRFLRPEFVSRYGEPLSPDACCAIAYKSLDSEKHLQQLEAASTYLMQQTIPNFTHDLLQRDYFLPVSEGLGIDLISEMHTAGVNIRHLGLMRSMLWRPLPGSISIYHHENIVRTNQDLRQEVASGDKINIDGAIYEIAETKRNKITHCQLPLSVIYMGESVNMITAEVGRADVVQNSAELRLLFLSEMLARTVKAIIRLQLRVYNQKFKCSSREFFISLACDYLNVVTGSSLKATEVFEELLYSSLKERFGSIALRPSERATFFYDIQPAIPHIIGRLVSMLGLRFCITCETEFHERPLGFLFSPADILEATPIVKHSIQMLPYADAVVVSLQADETEKELFAAQVLQDQPSIFYLLSERKGARFAENKGRLGLPYSAAINKGVELEHPGPVISDPFIRSMAFRPNAKSFLDIKYHDTIVTANLHDHFTLELYFKCTGGKDSVRVMAMSGRYAIQISRDNQLTAIFRDAGHEIRLRLEPVEYDSWKHVVVTYDGTAVRCYVNAILLKTVEVEEILKYKGRLIEIDAQKKRDELAEALLSEQREVRSRAKEEALQFFQTKEGVAKLKKLSREIMESDAFQADNIGANAKDQATAIKEKRLEALKRAKEQYIKEYYQLTIAEMAERYEDLRAELEDRFLRELKDGRESVQQALRIGAASPNMHTRDGSYFFHGELSCVAVFAACLSSDRVKSHFMSSVSDRRKDAQRLHGIAAAKFEQALRQQGAAPQEEGSAILSGYARSVCSYLRIRTADRLNRGKELGKLKIIEIMKKFKGMRLTDGIAEILRQIPREPEFADVVVFGFECIRNIDKNFFSKSVSLTRKEMVHFPFEFALLSPESPAKHWQIAAHIFQEVVRDIDLMFAYGELDLRWLPELHSTALVISLVKTAQEDKHLRRVSFAELFEVAGVEDYDVADDDVLVLTQNIALTEGLELNRCCNLTDVSISHIDRMQNLKILKLDYCTGITDKGLRSIRSLHSKLTVFSAEGLTLITDEGLLPLIAKCQNLVSFNVNKCSHVSAEPLVQLVRLNRRLSVLQMSGTRLNDEALCTICATIMQMSSQDNYTRIDISNCRDLTDIGVINLADTCSNLRALNLSGLSRVSDLAVQQVCGKCWYLEDLNLEDLFLLNDSSFWFSPQLDGRKAANENMLKSLRTLNLTDCSNLTDRGIEGLAERCRKLDILTLRGCDKLTDLALEYMADAALCADSTAAMCDSIHSMQLAYATGLTPNGILNMLPYCLTLEELDLSGLASVVTDDFIHKMCKQCPTLQKLTLQKCILISDASLCHIAEALWIEELDITGCHRITDDAIEVLSEACTGLRRAVLRRVKRVSDRSVFALANNCRGIRLIDVQECNFVSSNCVAEIRSSRGTVKIIS